MILKRQCRRRNKHSTVNTRASPQCTAFHHSPTKNTREHLQAVLLRNRPASRWSKSSLRRPPVAEASSKNSSPEDNHPRRPSNTCVDMTRNPKEEHAVTRVRYVIYIVRRSPIGESAYPCSAYQRSLLRTRAGIDLGPFTVV